MWGSNSGALVPESVGHIGIHQAGSQCPGRTRTQCKQENSDTTASSFVWRPLVQLLLEGMSVSNNSKPISPKHPFSPSHNRYPGSSHHTPQKPVISLPLALLSPLLSPKAAGVTL